MSSSGGELPLRTLVRTSVRLADSRAPRAQFFRVCALARSLKEPPSKGGQGERSRFSHWELASQDWAGPCARDAVGDGRYKATFVENPSAAKREPTHEEWSNHYVFGLVGDKEYDTRDWCPNGIAMARTGGNVGTSSLTIVTLGIYAPRKVYVTCADGQVAAAETSNQKGSTQ